MVNWTDIHPDFAQKDSWGRTYQQIWEEQGFTYEQVKKWKEVIGWEFGTSDLVFCSWLRDIKQITPQTVNDDNRKELKLEYWKTEIHPGFTLNLQKLWEKYSWDPQLTPQEAQVWINQGLTPADYDFAHYLKRNDYNPDQELDLVALRKEHQNNLTWTDIYWEFGKTNLGKTYQQIWEKENFTYQEAKELIEVGFTPHDYYTAKLWKDHGFTIQQTKSWIKKGLTLYEYRFATYLKQNNYQPNQITNLEKLKTEYQKKLTGLTKNAQEWLDYFYLQKEETEKINLGDLNPKQSGKLIINNYPNLKEVGKETYNDIFNIVKITIINCPKLKKARIWHFKNNQELILHNLPKLKWLDCWNNKLTNLDLSDCANLQIIHCSCSKLTEIKLPINGEKLETLKLNNNKLTELKINNLPKLKRLHCFVNKLITLDLTTCSNLQTIWCSNNLLTEIKLPSTAKEKLEELNLSNNNFNQDLSFLSHLVNLKELRLGNNVQERINKGIYNRFCGSLEPLQNLSKLKELWIDDTDIDSGLEYLPESVKEFNQSNHLVRYRKDAKCKIFKNILPLCHRNIEEWRKTEPAKLLINSVKLESIQTNLQNFLTKWKTYLLKQKELTQKEKQITYSEYIKWAGVTTSLASAGLAFQTEQEEIAKSSLSLALASGAIGAVSEAGKQWLEKKVEDLKDKLSFKEEEFNQKIKELKADYDQLIKLWQELSILSKTPTNSNEVNYTFSKFLVTIADLEQKIKKLNRNHVAINNEDEFEQTEQGIKELAENKEFAQVFQTSWEKYKVGETMDNFQKTIADYRKEYYQTKEEKPLPALPFIDSSRTSPDDNQSINNESVELTTFSSSSVNNQEQQAQIQVPPKGNN